MEGLDLNSIDLSMNTHGTYKSRLQKIGEFFMNYAALLCLLDCIVLPILIGLFGILDIFKGFDALAGPFHVIEIVCVVTLGTLAVIVNYRKGGKGKYALMGIAGIILVVCSHSMAEGWVETGTALSGCAMLLVSNHLSRRNHGCDHCHLPVAL